MATGKLQIRLTFPPAPADLAHEEEHRRTVRDLAAMYAAIAALKPGDVSNYGRGLMLAGWRAIHGGIGDVGTAARRSPAPPARRPPPAQVTEEKDKFADDLG